MSRRTRLQAAQIVLTALGVTALLTATALAANPDTATSRTQVTTAPPSGVPAPVVRRTPASFTPEMPFSEAIDILKNSTTPPLNIVVLWKPMGESAGVYKDTPIGIDGIPGLRVRQYLDMVVLSLSAGAAVKLGYVVHDGVVTIGPTDALPLPKRVTRVYDISDLVAEPARYFFPPMGFGGMGYNGFSPGGSMMGRAGGYGPGYAPGMSYPSSGPRGLSGPIGSLYGGANRPAAGHR